MSNKSENLTYATKIPNLKLSHDFDEGGVDEPRSTANKPTSTRSNGVKFTSATDLDSSPYKMR